ncbi:glycosyltransferase family 29 protein [Salinimicrobium sp. HB62]|uniref:glycosyltransferase family 29 protein n=1 Tax=Salinimicrobium sp. HB62 TaxID=3077781 RepID=UPI002D76899D|nr:glycosyltransferase family 29 protein [Salinimicrobium sp. HB62]
MRIVNTLRGILMMVQNTRIFEPRKHFKNKRIAIIGAADSAFEEANGDYINSFDYIVRVNKAPHSLTPEKRRFVGSRTDILFHSFFELTEGGGGVIDWQLYSKQGIKFVINPNNDLKGLRAHLNFYKRHLNPRKTYVLPHSTYKKIKEKFGNWVPTVGFSALYAAINSGCKELYITGFTFFKTPYADDYRDEVKDVEKNNQFMKKQGFHNPDLELNEFLNQLERQEKTWTKVIMDDALLSIVNRQKMIRNGR